MVHELCHVRLMGEDHVGPNIADNEKLTDLATQYFGFGIFTANSRFLKLRTLYGMQGYIPNLMISDALAAMPVQAGNTKPEWLVYLNGTTHSIYERSVRYLESAENST